jgi:hypothetical protein
MRKRMQNSEYATEMQRNCFVAEHRCPMASAAADCPAATGSDGRQQGLRKKTYRFAGEVFILLGL